jgi:hypothetical protein
VRIKQLISAAKNNTIQEFDMKNFLSFLLCCSVCFGSVIIETNDGADPESAGFTFYANGTFDKGYGSEGGEAYWFVQSTRAIYYLYTGAASDFQDQQGWTATFRTRSLPENPVAITDNFLCARDGAYRFDMSVCGGYPDYDAGVYALVSGSGYVRIDEPAVDVTQYHTYQAVYDPVSNTASYYIDGDLMASYPRTSLYTTTLAELRWGDQTSSTTGMHENRYADVRFETGQNPVKWVIYGSPSATEGETAEYFVKISGEPASPVTVTLTADSQLLVNGEAQIQLVFDPAVLPMPAQSVTVTAVDDYIKEGDHFGFIYHAAASDDADYNFEMRDVAVNIFDNDIAGIEISQTQLAGAEGDVEPMSYELVLTSSPASDVTVSFVTDSQLHAVNPIVFNSLNWSEPQAVNVFIVDDEISEGPQSSIISHVVSSSDSEYNNIQVADVLVDIEDNEPWCGQAGTFYFGADFNGDCFIDSSDIQSMAQMWLMSN